MPDEETVPLLPKTESTTEAKNRSTYWRILICAFIISLSIAFTWVPMIYAFRVMTCDEYYLHNEPYTGKGDRCAISHIEASTATSVSILGTTTTIFGVINLFISGWSIKKFGVKAALIAQTVWPSLRLCIQVWGVRTGFQRGKDIIQVSQLICMLGGPAGYLLVTNAYIAEVVKPEDRTSAFGALQGCVMFGTAFGYILGGQVGDIFGISKPFETAFFLMIISTLYSIFLLPYLAPHKPTVKEVSGEKPKRTLKDLAGPLKMVFPQSYEMPDGKIIRHWGRPLLAFGVFLGVLATGFIPVLIQMYATNVFAFHPTENGYLMALNSLIRGGFLTFCFPRIITHGRRWFAKSSPSLPTTPLQIDIPTEATDYEAIPALQSEQEPLIMSERKELAQGSAFDLFFLRWSLVADAILTGSAGFSRKGWHIYLAASLLPLASGSAAAAKGTMIDMCAPDERTDALSAITFVEMLATLSTMSIFGAVFSYLSERNAPHLVFFCNAALAFVAVFFLMFCRFPPASAKKVTT